MKKNKKVEDETIIDSLKILWKDGYKRTVISYITVVLVPATLLALIALIFYVYIAYLEISNYF